MLKKSQKKTLLITFQCRKCVAAEKAALELQEPGDEGVAEDVSPEDDAVG